MSGARINIAIIKLSSLGDVIHALPVPAALRAVLPDARLTWIVEIRESGILRDHPALDSVISVDTRGWRRRVWSTRGLRDVRREVTQLRRSLRDAGFDVAIDLQGLLKSGLLTAFTRARLRIGFAASRCWEPLNALFTNRRVTPPPTAVHIVDQYLSLLAPLGVTNPVASFSVARNPAAAARVDEFLAGEGVKPRDRVVVLIPGARRANKRWPIFHFRALADRLTADAAARVVVAWGPGEQRLARAIASGLWSRPVLAPSTDLDELAALLRRSSVLVGADTGPLHLAAAVGTPAIGLYGPTAAERNRPYGSTGRGIQSPDGLMASITPAEVFEAVVKFLA